MSEEKQVIISESQALLRMAIDKDLDIDKLERLIDMDNAEEQRRCKQDFDINFGLMQKAFSEKTITKDKEVRNKDDTATLYKFCPLDNILKVFGPTISEHGFYYRWDEEAISETEKRIFCIVSGYGHEIKGYVDIPIQPGTTFTNSIQQRGVSTSYGKRYSFINVFGINIAGEDTDALTFEDGVMYGEDDIAIQNCNTLDDLKEYWTNRYKELSTEGRKIITVRINKRKKELQAQEEKK
jgi:hypothetical protein